MATKRKGTTPVTQKRNSMQQDKREKALHPGKRTSKSGNIYYENRENRSDKDRRKKY